MDNNRVKIELPGYAKSAIVLAGIYLFIYGVVLAKEILVPIAFAALFATLLTPVANFLERARFINRIFSTILVVLLAILIFALLIFGLYKQALLFLEEMPYYSSRFFSLLHEVQVWVLQNTPFTVNLEVESVRNSILGYIQDNIQQISNILFSIVGTITVFILIPVYIFLFLYYRTFLQDFMFLLYKKNSTEAVNSMAVKIQKVAKGYVGGMFLVSLILSVFNTAGLWILGIEHAIFFGFFAGFLNVIPYIGPIVGSILPIVFTLLTKDSAWYAVGVFLYFYVVQLIESYIFIPAIVGKHVNMNPLVVIVGLFIGFYIWGVVGMIIIIPVIAVLKRVFDEIEALKPFGFLIGGVPGKADEKELFFKRLKDRIQKKH